MPADVYVFAYGSNLHPNRIKHRAPSACLFSIGFVAGRRLEFRKRSLDGSAKADARLTGDPADRVWGAVYRVNSRDKNLLDRYESLGIGYDEFRVDVNIVGDQSLSALIYVARKEMIDNSMQPYSWYLDFVRQGAVQHCLPFCYIKRWIAVESVIDPNADRQFSNSQILNGALP